MNLSFSIKGASVQAISQNEIALLLECETASEAQLLDRVLDDYSIGWYDKNENLVSLALRAPNIGGYLFDVRKTALIRIKEATVLCVSYRLQTGQLEALPPRELNLIYRPM